VVVELGYGTAGVAVGDEVYGLIDGYRDGAAAELMAIEARDVAPAPTRIDHSQAASRPQAGLTSWQALFDHGQLTSGRTVMIHAAGGAVGSIAVQLAKAKGLRVVGTGRSKVKPLVLDLGADKFVDVEQDGRQDNVEHLAVVFDTLGGDVLARSAGIVKPCGTLVSVASPPPADRAYIRAVQLRRDPSRAQLVEIAQLVDAGQLRTQVGGVYALAEARQALTAKLSGGIPGRVVLQP
jgi:NADPH:quinone reductase-like Zn-dependent oxidoreductase